MIDTQPLTAEDLWIESQVSPDSIEVDERHPRILLGPPPWEGLVAIWWQMFMEGRETPELAAFSVEAWARERCITIDP